MATNKLFGLLLLIGTFNCSTDNSFVITPGVGTDKLQVGQTKVKTALSILGDNYEYNHLELNCDDCYNENKYTYPQLGLTIISHVDGYKTDSQNLDNAIICNLIFEKSTKTTNNLEIGKSNKENVISMYGQSESKDTCITYLHYRTKGISFAINPVTKKITAIDVYEKNDYPDIWCETTIVNTSYH